MENYMDQLLLMSLFAGSGGLDLGFESSGFNIPLAIDSNQAAIETYNKNRRPARTAGRVADLSRIDSQLLISWWIDNAGLDAKPQGIIGGPPCQSFSVANVHKSPEDPRAKLPLDYARILKSFNDEFDLDFFLFENVTGLAHRQHKDSMRELLSLFESTGFDVRVLILDAVEFNVPQYRKRLFIFGVKSFRFDLANFQIPSSGSPQKTVRQTIEGLPKPRFFSRNDRPDEADVHANHWCMNPRSPKFENGYLLTGSSKGRSFRVLDWDLPSRTVSYGHREVH